MQKNWEEIWCGNVIKLNADDPIPADILLLTTSDEKGLAYVETKNLDGETNLKQKSAHKDLYGFFEKNQDIYNKIANIQGMIECEGPNNDIHNFQGTIEMPVFEQKISLGKENLLLKGSIIRNIEYLYGIVIYTGHHTKVMMNSSRPYRNQFPT